MIETKTTITDPKIICSACHESLYRKRYKHIITKENQRKRCQCKFLKIYSSKIYLQVGLKKKKKKKKTVTKKKRLLEEKAGCIYQNYKGYQNDEQKFLKKECDMRISRCVIPVG